MFNNSPHSTYVNSFSLVSFDIIRPLWRVCDKQGFTKLIGVTLVVDKYVNSSIYFFGFYYFLWFTLALYILGPLKCLMTFESINSIETTNPLFLWVPFLILFFHVFVKYKHDLRLKYVLIAFVFLCSSFYLSTYIVYNNVKLCSCLQFYSSVA